jgi:hypothetical protein
MNLKRIGLAVLLVLPVTSISCSFLHRSPLSATAASQNVKGNPGTLAPNPAIRPAGRVVSKNTSTAAAADEQTTVSVPATDPPGNSSTMGEVALGGPQPPLTESLDKTLALLAREKADSEALRKTVADLKDSLAQKEQQIGELSAQMRDSSVKIEKLEGALDKWKEDVLGFRDEMRKAEESQIDALQQILTMLGKGKEQDKK